MKLAEDVAQPPTNTEVELRRQLEAAGVREAGYCETIRKLTTELATEREAHRRTLDSDSEVARLGRELASARATAADLRSQLEAAGAREAEHCTAINSLSLQLAAEQDARRCEAQHAHAQSRDDLRATLRNKLADMETALADTARQLEAAGAREAQYCKTITDLTEELTAAREAHRRRLQLDAHPEDDVAAALRNRIDLAEADTADLRNQLEAAGAREAGYCATIRELTAELENERDRRRRAAERTVVQDADLYRRASAAEATLDDLGGLLENSSAQDQTAQQTVLAIQHRLRDHHEGHPLSSLGAPAQHRLSDPEQLRFQPDIVFVQPGVVGARWVRTFLSGCFGDAHHLLLASDGLDYPLVAHELGNDWVPLIEPEPIRALSVNAFLPPTPASPASHGPYLVTILRDPIARICSEYLRFHALSSRFHALLPPHLEAPCDSVVAFARQLRRNNHYVRFFAGANMNDDGVSMLQRAIEQLRDFAVIGFSDRAEEALAGLVALPLPVSPEVIAEARTAAAAAFSGPGAGEEMAASLDAVTRATLEALNGADIALCGMLRSGTCP
ncbi:MAG: hypothetical protein IT537_22915 [Hyphomicrobiales bacterium]|nr:hypothetical protein [Hyphomicrobiales bacterium]